ncbi:hypothetical protein WUBG_12437, partial [Wuchereria bancrofti]
MPGATLTIEKGVEVHVWPNVRILVLGNLKAEGTYWEPIRFKPINVTEYVKGRDTIMERHKRSNHHCSFIRSKNLCRYQTKRQIKWYGKDAINQYFPSLNRYNSYYQQFGIRLNGTKPTIGFLEFYNATTNEWIPSCDRAFTIRNAQVVCRELGFKSFNVYEWLTPRWDYNPKLTIPKNYVTPRQCTGEELKFDHCPLRMSNNL